MAHRGVWRCHNDLDEYTVFSCCKYRFGAGLIRLERLISKSLHFYSVNILSQKQTCIQGLSWNVGEGIVLAGAAGVGSNQPYAGIGLTVKRERLWARVGYVYEGDRFRRITVQSPINSEVDKENILIVASPFRRLLVSGGYQHLLQPRQDPKLPFVRATVSQVQVSGDVFGVQLGGGLFSSQQARVSNLGEVVWASRKLSPWLDTGVQYYCNHSGAAGATSMLTGRLRESVWRGISILELINHSTRTSLGVGGGFQSNRVSFDVDYSTIYVPFGNAQFKQSLGFTVRVEPFRGTTLNAQSYVTSDGETKYGISGSASVFQNFPLLSAPRAELAGFTKYVIRGRVVDIDGNPIYGAAISIEDHLLITNSSGEFMLRTRRAQRCQLQVSLDNFVNPTPFEVAFAPTEVLSAPEPTATLVRIVLNVKGSHISQSSDPKHFAGTNMTSPAAVH